MTEEERKHRERMLAFATKKMKEDKDGQKLMFDEPDPIKGMVPRYAWQTEKDAALAIARHCKTKLQRQIIQAFKTHGAMTDEELENLPQFTHYGPTTVKKRRTELFQMGMVINTGRTKANSRGIHMIIWDLAQELK
jgi:hypothetical protein